MHDLQPLIVDTEAKLAQALSYLSYSYEKVQRLPRHFAELDQETLETWESFSARFARIADLFLNKYLRLYLTHQDPGYQGTLRDRVNLAEKYQLIDSAATWMEIREVRNVTAHEYSEQAFDEYAARLLELTPHLLKLGDRFSQ